MIRYAQKEELERVNELRKQVSNVHANGRPDLCRGTFSAELQAFVYKLWESKDCDIIVAIRDNVICGFASVEYVNMPLSPYMLPKRYYNILEFGVDKAYRRKKVATELFEFIKQESIKKGFDKLELEVFTFNEAAIKFYESIGFCAYSQYMEYFPK